MARLALALYLIFLVLAFGWRSWLQWRRTGDHGFRGLSGRVGSAEWLGGALLILGGVAALLAPIADLAGWLAPAAGRLPTPLGVAGVAAMLSGAGLTLLAQVQMGASWRVGVDPSERTALVTHGVFGSVRNPIYSSMLLALAGLALAVPNALSWLGFAVVLLGLELHVRRVEEPYLLRTHGDAYQRYAAATGRFLPGIGRLA